MKKKYLATINDQQIPIEIEPGDCLTIRSGTKEWQLDVHQAGFHHYSILHEGKSYDLRFFHEGNTVSAFLDGERISFTLEDSKTSRSTACCAPKDKTTSTSGQQGPVEIVAMMPGKVVSIKVGKGDVVSEGQGVVVLEAMKMENEMPSPKNGTVSEIRVTEGESVENGTVMMVIE